MSKRTGKYDLNAATRINKYEYYYLEQEWLKISNDDKFEVLRLTYWNGLTDYEAEREQGDGIGEAAGEWAKKGIYEILDDLNGQKTGDECPAPMIMKFLQLMEDMKEKNRKTKLKQKLEAAQ